MGVAKQRFDTLAPYRDVYDRQARRAAAVTLPWVMPPEGHSYSQELPDPYTGFGARLVVNLANKITMAIFPAGQKFFRFTIPAHIMRKLTGQGPGDVDPSIEQNLTYAEDDVQYEADHMAWRQPTFNTMLNLIITGNAMEQMLPNNAVRTFRLDQYVVVRAPSGEMVEFVVRELFTDDNLPEALQPLAATAGNSSPITSPVAPASGSGVTGSGSAVTHGLYTHGKLVDGVWEIYQDLDDVAVPGTEGKYEIPPFKAYRWNEVLGEHYGRGKVDEHYPDLYALNMLEKGLLDGAAMAARNVTFVRPNAGVGAMNMRRKLTKAENGSVLIGNFEDIGTLQFENINGMQFTDQRAQRLSQELAAAFMMQSGQTREAERVTAFELRQLAQELEGTLGGVYSMLSTQLQVWRLRRLMIQMQAQEKLPPFPPGVVEPTILTGLEALSREAEFQRVLTAGQFLQTMPPEVTSAYVKWPSLLTTAFNGLGIPDAVKDEDTVTQERAQQMKAEAEAAAIAKGQPEGGPAPAQQGV